MSSVDSVVISTVGFGEVVVILLMTSVVVDEVVVAITSAPKIIVV